VDQPQIPEPNLNHSL